MVFRAKVGHGDQLAMSSGEPSIKALSKNILMEEEGIGEVVLFHTRCVVKERRVNLTIDEGSAVNMVSIEVVENWG